MTEETRLDELLNDPMIQLVMERDGVDPQRLRQMIERAQARRDGLEVPPAHVIVACRQWRGACA